MKASVVDMRYKTRELLKAVERGEKVVIMFHGIPKAELTPISSSDRPKKREKVLRRAGAKNTARHPYFGMWKDRKDLSDPSKYVRKIRSQSRFAI